MRGAWLDNGLLHIDLMRPPVETRVRTIEIRSPQKTAGNQARVRTVERS